MNPSDENKVKSPPSSSAKPRTIPLTVIILLIATIAAALFYFNTKPSPVSTPTTTPPNGGIVFQETTTPPEENIGEPSQQPPLSPPTLVAEEITQTPLPFQDLQQPETLQPAITEQPDLHCEKAVRQLNDFYSTLDKQAYMNNYGLTTSSQEHFTALVKKLLANPPQVSRESDDLYTILKNTAHFFRISGKENIFMMKGILDHENDKLEQILADYYTLSTSEDCAKSRYAKDIDDQALYEYACFFLNTMGGRLYLFRRDSLSRMVVTYYAILIVDRANRQNDNRHGIALKPSIDMLIPEMEAGGSALKYSDRYLDTLYDLKELYQ